MRDPQNWRQYAECLNMPVDWWFPNDKSVHSYRLAKSVCDTCSVKGECLKDALDNEIGRARDGMRAGLRPGQRVRLQEKINH